ncbi:MAG: efflux RND transporter periplasmic adaptor subunit [Nitrospiraceae bacterium]|nr:efflux RND transporter periplasmic adaptor subunit [Nitrospiraceae bacterium]
MTRHSLRKFRCSLSLSLLLAYALLAGACTNEPEEATGAKPQPEQQEDGLVRLTQAEIERGDIVVRPVTRGEFRTYRDFPATIAPNHHATAEITALVRGRVVDVYADLGQQVKAGDLLAILYSSELGMAQSAYLKASAKLYVAEQAYERAKTLLQEKVIGLAESQRRQGEMLSVRAEKRESQDRLRLLGMSEEQIRQLDRQHKIQSYVPIVAPFESRVIARNLTRGEVVEVTEKLFTVADLSEVWALANIPEKDIPFIRADGSAGEQLVEVLVTAYPGKVFHGKVTYVGDVLDVATRTMRLRIEVPNPDRKLKPEMYATIRVYSEPETKALTVPEAAVQRERERKFVFVQQDDAHTFKVREIKLGESNGEMVKVTEGLREGEHIVTSGAFILKSELLGEQL